MTAKVYCGNCRREVDKESYNFWQGTAWCAACEQVVYGSMCKVPGWTIAVILFMALRLRIT